MNTYLPVMLLKELILLPTQEVKIELNNYLSKKIVKLSNKHHNGDLLIICPKDSLEEAPDINDLPNIGVIGHIKSKIELPNGNTRVTIVGTSRVNILEYRSFEDDKEVLMSDVKPVEISKKDLVEQTAIRRKLLKIFNTYVNESSNISNSIIHELKEITDLDKVTDLIASFIPLQFEKKLFYVEELNSLKRGNQLIQDITIELEIIALDKKMDISISKELENNQKEYILKEKLAYIKKELGLNTEDIDFEKEYIKRIENLNLNNKTKKKLLSEINKLSNIPENHPEASVIRNYLDTILSLPWNKSNNDETDINKIRNSLDKTHYGLKNAKMRILEYVAVKKRNPDIKSPIICLVGPPGVGKTSFGMNVAKSLKREFYKISVGGLNDTNELMGNRRTYIGSSPGKVIQALIKCGVNNPVILIDEIDKMVKNNNGDPASSMLEILDSEQNMLFTDNYIEEPFDISKVLFILTANDENSIPRILKDRLEIIELSSYTEFEKLDIAKKYLIPSILKSYKLSNKSIKFNDDVIIEIINNYTKESGLRELKRIISTLIRKIIVEFNTNEIYYSVKQKDLAKFLGKAKYNSNKVNYTLRPGLCNALAYTPLGGVVIPIESCLYEGTGKIIESGSLGKIAEESVLVALSYIKSNKDIYQINDYYFEHKDIHLHFLNGSSPKNGPSSGIAIVTSLLSLILNKNIAEDIAMTGEITLRGDILKIGGFKEKILGAYNNGIRQVFIPMGNVNDLDEIPQKVRENMDIVPVSNYIEIFQQIFN